MWPGYPGDREKANALDWRPKKRLRSKTSAEDLAQQSAGDGSPQANFAACHDGEGNCKKAKAKINVTVAARQSGVTGVTWNRQNSWQVSFHQNGKMGRSAEE